MLRVACASERAQIKVSEIALSQSIRFFCCSAASLCQRRIDGGKSKWRFSFHLTLSLRIYRSYFIHLRSRCLSSSAFSIFQRIIYQTDKR